MSVALWSQEMQDSIWPVSVREVRNVKYANAQSAILFAP